jgi:hypothetical protein
MKSNYYFRLFCVFFAATIILSRLSAQTVTYLPAYTDATFASVV